MFLDHVRPWDVKTREEQVVLKCNGEMLGSKYRKITHKPSETMYILTIYRLRDK